MRRRTLRSHRLDVAQWPILALLFSNGFARSDPAGKLSLEIWFESAFSDFNVDDPKKTVKQSMDLFQCEKMLHQPLFKSMGDNECVGGYLFAGAIFKVVGGPQITVEEPAALQNPSRLRRRRRGAFRGHVIKYTV